MNPETQRRIAALMRVKFAMDHFTVVLCTGKPPAKEPAHRTPEPDQKAFAIRVG